MAELLRLEGEMREGHVPSLEEVGKRLKFAQTPARAQVLNLLFSTVPLTPLPIPDVPLTPTERLIVEVMAAYGGRPVPTSAFAEAFGWACDCGTAAVLRTHVTNIRAKGVEVRTWRSGWGYSL